ncbi:MAG: helix-turn-helix transcriptional regulator [Propionibacteriaceae bacterium]|jgi:DNA-binding CsgD family transcriptional regulator|nr:helix-turn-helix transcriptional regulator [Propionibacteriaceae bacterium]
MRDTVIGYLREGISVNLVGLPGSGRSTLARAVRTRLGELGNTVFQVNAVADLKERALAALATSGIEIPAGAGMVAGAVNALTRVLPGPSATLLVDDADDLDQLSLGAISAAHARTGFTVLFVTRRAGPQRTFSAIQPSVRVHVGPLPFDQLHMLIRELLPEGAQAQTVARIATMTGGLPGPAHGLIEVCRRNERLVLTRDGWSFGPRMWCPELSPVVENLLADLDAGQLDALLLLAISGTSTIGRANQLVTPDRIAQLDAAGLLQVISTANGQVLGIFPPLVTEYLRHESKPTALLAARESNASHDPKAVLATEGLGASPTALDPGQAAVLSGYLTGLWQTEVAVARAAWEAKPNPTAAIRLLAALHAAGAPSSEAAQVLRNTSAARSPRQQALLLVWDAIYRAEYSGLPKALAKLASGRVRLPQCEALLQAAEAHLRFTNGEVPQLPLAGAAGEDRLGEDLARSVEAEILLARGMTLDAGEILAQHHPADPVFTAHADTERALAQVLHGEIDAGLELACSRLANTKSALDPGVFQCFGYVITLGLALQGRLTELNAFAGTLLTLTRTGTLYRDYWLGVLGLTAVAARWRRETDFANALANQLRCQRPRSGPFPGMSSHTLAQLVLDPAANVWGAVTAALDKGYVAAAVVTAAAAVERRPDQVAVGRLQKVLKHVQSPMLRAIGEYAVTTANGDLDRLDRVIDRLRDTGAIVHAVRASVQLALALRRKGQRAMAVSSADAGWAMMRETGAQCEALFAPLVADIDLSSREREICACTNEGMSTSQIAALYELSVRTVENHVSNMYRKIGVSSRSRLRAVTTTWLAP